MFNNIAPSYDIMNRMMTMGIDRQWRRRAVRTVACTSPSTILDIATGTGDLAIALSRACPKAKVTGIDLSQGMMDIATQKVSAAGMSDKISFRACDALHMPFADDSFDAITVAFGVRNFEHLREGYAEMYRVLHPGGLLCVLELSTPSSPIVKPFYSFYTRAVIPLVGRMVSRDNRAYSYLPQSIRAVPVRKAMTDIIAATGFREAAYKSLTFGVCTMYTATK